MWNWSGVYQYQAATVETPATADHVAQIVRTASHVRALGTRHCFTDIADSPLGVLISTQNLNRILALNATATPTVIIEPGVTYGQLGEYLHAAGWALPNLASLPHISVAGAVATATHGSGEQQQCLSAAVVAMELVTADGTLKTLQKGDEDFPGAVVHLGALGIVTKLTLAVLPTFEIAQHVYDRVPMEQFVHHIDQIAASVYSVSAFTDWQHDIFSTVWMKSRAGQPHFDLQSIGGILADGPRHPIAATAGNVASQGAGPNACTQQLGIPGPWHQRLPHFRLEFTPSSGEEIQSEYFVPRHHAADAIAAVASLRDRLAPLLQVSEVRFIAADDFWLSMCHGRPSLALHFTWRNDLAGVRALLPTLEAALAKLQARPHWGKLFTLPGPELSSRYPKFDAFRQLRRRFDPTGKFNNAFLDRVGL